MRSKQVFVINLMKTAFFCLLAVGILTANYFIEKRFDVPKDEGKASVLSIDVDKENVFDRSVLRFDGGEAEVLFADEVLHQYGFGFESGKMWGNGEISSAKVNIVVGKTVLIPNGAAFSLDVAGDEVSLKVFKGDVYLGFLDEGLQVGEYVDTYDEMFVNRLLVPQGTKIEFKKSDITAALSALLDSKLMKEFRYTAITEEDRADEWVVDNLKKDGNFEESLRLKFIEEARGRGQQVQDGAFSGFVDWAEKTLTFVPAKKREIYFENLFKRLDDAIYFDIQGTDPALSENSLLDFEGFLASLPAEISESEEFYERYDDYLDRTSVFAPGDLQYDVFSKILDIKLLRNRDTKDLVNMLWQDVYAALEMQADPHKAMNRFYAAFQKTLGVDDQSRTYLHYVTYYNQLFDNLFQRYATFYRDGYFAIKYSLEQELLSLYSNGQQKEELRQSLISNKISFLKRLRFFFFENEGGLTVSETKEILSRLVEEVDEMMPTNSSEVAVTELFETQLRDIGDFWGYLNSPEYYNSTSYGRDHKERYAVYLEEKDTIWSFVNVRQDVLGEEVVEEETVESVADAVKALLLKNQDISQVEIGEFDESGQRYIPFKAVIQGYPFEAIYDRDRDALKDVYVYDALIADRAVKLNNLLSLIQSEVADVAGTGEEAEALEGESTETYSKRLARIYIAEQIQLFGFDVLPEKVSLVDEDKLIYKIFEVSLKGFESTIVTFDYIASSEKATNVSMIIGGESVDFAGEFTLEELKKMITAEEDFSGGEVPDSGGKVLR